jgi:hypothetical protein
MYTEISSHLSKKLCQILLALTSMPILLLAGCAGGGATQPTSTANTNVSLLAATTTNDSVGFYDLVVKKLSLVSKSGAVASLITLPVQAEFIHLNGPVEPIATAQVPQGVYTSAAITVGDYNILCTGLAAQGGLQGQGVSGQGQSSTVSISLPNPITVSGDNMNITLNLVLAQFVSSSACTIGSIAGNQQFEMYTGNKLQQPIDPSPQKLNALQGIVGSTSATGFRANSIEGFSSDVAPSPSWTVETNVSTIYQGVSAFSSLAAGMPVEFDGTLQSDGTLLASRIAVFDTNTTNLSVWSGPLLSVDSSARTLFALGRVFAGPVYGGQLAPFDSSQAKFQVSGELSNLGSLPFTPVFSNSTMVPGQNVDLTFHEATYPSGNGVPPIATMTLVSQTIDGQITAINQSGNFTAYTVWLATNDPLASLAFQVDQNNLLTNPRVVTVYVDNNTQTLNSLPLAVNGIMRFTGLVFNDNGALRMDCAQINDGYVQ